MKKQLIEYIESDKFETMSFNEIKKLLGISNFSQIDVIFLLKSNIDIGLGLFSFSLSLNISAFDTPGISIGL